jgi:signal transduction histidine kinase
MKTILIIEDDASLRTDVVELFQLEGYKVLEAESGEQGLAVLAQNRPNLILCDVMMPGIDGYAVLTAVRSQPRLDTTPFIFLTAKSSKDDLRRGMTLGADDYLTKPLSTQDLLQAVNVRLERHEKLMQAHQDRIEEAKKTFIRMVAHELRTPLVSISMIHDILSRRTSNITPTELEEYLEMLGAGKRRLTHLVEQMVIVTQLESDLLNAETLQAEATHTSVWDLLMSSINLARNFATRNLETDINLDMLDQATEVSCAMYPTKHALAEVIANAINFSPPRGVVDVKQWQSGGNIWISITDSGEGIPQEMMTLVSQRFEQLNREQVEQQGVGMGLPIANRIFQLHGGGMDIRSVVGKGTQVNIYLPVVAEDE